MEQRDADRSTCGPAAEVRVAGASGLVWGDASPAFLDEVRRWVEDERVEGASPIKGERVVRSGDLLVKFLERSRSRFPLRASRALRTGRRHAELTWLPVPAPRIALDLPPGGRYEGLFAMQYVEGELLHEMDDPHAVAAALGAFVARMHAAGVHHGDLHSANVIFDGERWWLIDLDALRSRLHRLRERRLVLRQWANFASLNRNVELVRTAFERYLVERPDFRADATTWEEVLETADELTERWIERQERRGAPVPPDKRIPLAAKNR